MMCYFTSCGGGKKTEAPAEAAETTTTEAATPEYKVINDLPNVDITTFPKDDQGRYIIFDGKTFNGWRGYGKAEVPGAWTIEDGAIKINGSGAGEAGASNGGDLIFADKVGNFELEFEWKVAKGSNSGVFIMIQEVESEGKLQPSYISAPEYQVLDNENHPDAKLGKDGNRKSGSLYDMIPAKPQNAKPFGEWNKSKIHSLVDKHGLGSLGEVTETSDFHNGTIYYHSYANGLAGDVDFKYTNFGELDCICGNGAYKMSKVNASGNNGTCSGTITVTGIYPATVDFSSLRVMSYAFSGNYKLTQDNGRGLEEVEAIRNE